jgi:hypothetical protein
MLSIDQRAVVRLLSALVCTGVCSTLVCVSLCTGCEPGGSEAPGLAQLGRTGSPPVRPHAAGPGPGQRRLTQADVSPAGARPAMTGDAGSGIDNEGRPTDPSLLSLTTSSGSAARVDSLLAVLCPVEPRARVRASIEEGRGKLTALRQVNGKCAQAKARLLDPSVGPEGPDG